MQHASQPTGPVLPAAGLHAHLSVARSTPHRYVYCTLPQPDLGQVDTLPTG